MEAIQNCNLVSDVPESLSDIQRLMVSDKIKDYYPNYDAYDLFNSFSLNEKILLLEPNFRPMVFDSLMIKALLDGRKTQRRVIVDNEILQLNRDTKYWSPEIMIEAMRYGRNREISLHDKIIWVKESFIQKDERIIYRSDVDSKYELPDGYKWKSSSSMPKSVCRLFLKVTKVRLARLHDISESDSISEGIEIIERPKANPMFKDYNLKGTMLGKTCPIKSYESLWSSINGQKSWDENPFVWVHDFKLVNRPYDFLE